MRLRKQKKAVAVTLATAIAVSTISASASAVSYDLANGDVTIDQNQDRGAFSYQGEDKEENRTYVNEDKDDDGKIIIKQADKNTATDNTVTVKEDVKKTEGGKDVDIVVDGVNVDTSKDADTSAASKDDRTAVTVGEGADVNLTVKDSTLTTGGNGIDLGKDLDGKDENKDTKVDLTLEGSTIKLTEKDNTAGIDARDNSKVDISLKGNNTIDGKKALEDAAKEAEEAGGKKTPNRNVEGIRVGGESAGDSGDGKGSTVTIKGDETGDGGNLNIDHTSTGMVITNKSDVTLTDSADVDIKHTEAGSSTQGGRGVVARGDLTVEDKSSLTIDTVGKGAYKIDDDKGGLVYGNNGYGIDGTADITVKDGSKLEIKGTQNSAIYGGKDASLTVDNDSKLDIDSNGRGIDYEGTAGDILFRDSEVDIDSKGMGISVAPGGSTDITFDHSNGTIAAADISPKPEDKGIAIYGPESDGKGKLTFTNESDVTLDASTGIYAGFDEVEMSGKSKVTSKGSVGMMFVGGQSSATKLHVTGGSEYDLLMKGYAHAMRVNLSKNASSILVDQNSKLNLSQETKGASAIVLGNGATLTVDNGTVTTEGNFVKGIYSLGSNSTTTIKDGSHVDVNSIVGTKKDNGQKLIVTGGTLTYDYSLANTLWPENAQGNKLTNFWLTKDAEHADFGTFAYNGEKYEYISDLDKETDKEHLSVWVPAAALEYMLDVDGSHDPEIIGKTLADLQAAGYNFNTKYKTPDGVIVLRDMVVNGHSLNFTKTTDENGNTKLIWGNYENRADGTPNAYDMVYGTEYEYEGKTYTIVWGYEHKNNANGAAGRDQNILDAFDADSNVKVTGENITGENADDYTVTIYGALREVVEPTPNPEPTPDPDTPDTPVSPEDPTTPPVQDAAPDETEAETPVTPENPANPPVQDATPDSTVAALPKTGVNWFTALAMALSGMALTVAGAFTSLFAKSKH